MVGREMRLQRCRGNSAIAGGFAAAGNEKMTLKALILGSGQTRVKAVEDLNPKFRMITVHGRALQNVAWTPGDKIEIQLGSWAQRTYTPLAWDAAEGSTQIVVYQHSDGPGTDWARALRAGD